MAKTKVKGKVDRKTLKEVLRYLRPYRFLFVLSIIFAMITVASTLYIPILVGKTIDYIVGQNNVDFEGIFKLLIQIGVVSLITAIIQWCMNAINNKIAFQTVRDIRDEAIRKVEILPLKFIDANAHGEIVSRIITDADQFADGLLLGFAQLFTGFLTIIGTLLFMLFINWRIAFIVIFLTPLSLFVARFIASRTHKMFQKQSDIRAEQTALVDEMIVNQKIVQAFSYEDKSLEEFDKVNDKLEKTSRFAIFYSSITNPSTRYVNSLVYAGVSLVGALTAIATGGVFSVGQLTVFLSYANQYTKPFNEISGVIVELQNAFICFERLHNLIEEEPQVPDVDNASTLKDVEGNIRLENVDFSYIEDKKIIKDFSLDVERGKRIAIVGPTGCGKTTIINLLMRFYDVDSGKIEIDNNDIMKSTRGSVRKNFGMVLQDTWLKTGTIRDNIVMGKPYATDEEVISAAKSAYADSFIRRLPDGYNTIVGEGNDIISEGQKQLICITRVMLCLPPMLILDEATSDIDTRTEIKIQNAFAKLMKGRTSIVIAHRLSTIKEADVIVVMKDGHIIEKGNHESLLENKGFYAEMYNSQFDTTD